MIHIALSKIILTFLDIYPPELQLNKAYTSDTEASFLD